MDPLLLLIFLLVYFGMILGEIPGLALDRAGVALLGAIAAVATGRLTPETAWKAIDVPTIALLFGLMIVSAQFRLGGFYDWIVRRVAGAQAGPTALLGLLIAAAGALSSLLANDIVCLAMAPVLLEGCARRRLNPMPFLLGLACAANVGSAATLIGNPQNMLIGQTLKLSFLGYLGAAAAPSVLGLAATWGILCALFRGKWQAAFAMPPLEETPFNAWQTTKGLAILVALVAVFLFAPWPREIAALAAAGLLLTSRKMATRDILGLVDWHLLVLFIGLFILNAAMAQSGMLAAGMNALERAGVAVQHPVWMFGLSVGLSNLVSNVPAVMLLLPAASHPLAGPVLALSSTLAGNLFIVGSIANIIVVDKARQLGFPISWREHAQAGIPVTLVTLAIAAGWLCVR